MQHVLPIVRAVRERKGCSFLVFGCGNDSRFWEAVSADGLTVFLEDDPAWAKRINAGLKRSPVITVTYITKLRDWLALLDASERLNMFLPLDVITRKWDVILVDGDPAP